MEINSQAGVARDATGVTVIRPDAEIDLGLDDELEVGLDMSLATTGDASFSPSHLTNTSDHLWLHLKTTVQAARDGRAVPAIALQIGPRIPILAGYAGPGIEGLVIVDGTTNGWQLAANFGAFVDPRATTATLPPVGVNLGLDVEHATPWRSVSITGEVAGTVDAFDHNHQASGTVGATFTSAYVTYAAQYVCRYDAARAFGQGVLLGASARFALW